MRTQNMKCYKLFYSILLILFHSEFKRIFVNGNDEDVKIPKLPMPVYDNEGRIKFFPRIVGGEPVKRGHFRGVVSVQIGNSHICGGTWYDDGFGNNTHILTAAHCVKGDKGRVIDPRMMHVMGDDLSIGSFSRSFDRQMRKVKKIIMHPLYDSNRLINDVAILILSQPFKQTSTFGPILLATRDVIDYEECEIAGWGSDGKRLTTPELLAVNISVIPHRICNSASAYKGIVGPDAFCAGSMEGGRDSCQGDSGGGLICRNGQLHGIVSYGRDCGKKGYPGVYTNVFRYIRWIRTQNYSSTFRPMISLLAIIICKHLSRLIFL